MEITCQQCSTAFSVDAIAAPGADFEVVCPNCFQLHKVVAAAEKPAPGATGVPSRDTGAASDSVASLLGEGGVVDRLRDGFTLAFELRHSSWTIPKKLNPYEIKRRIYQGEFDGSEEFRENMGRWFSIGEHPDFAQVFQLIGKPVQARALERPEAGQTRFTGWRSVKPPPAPAAPVVVVEEPEPEPEVRPRRWGWIAAVAVAGAGVVVAALLLI